MRVRLLKWNIVMNTHKYDADTKVATVKFFGTMQRFREDEYEVVKESEDEQG